jgi:CubicO group peptidase (beta-lactamase class C family)
VWAGGTADAPELAPLARPITVLNLLNHTAGFTYDFFPDHPVVELYRRADLWSAGSLDEFVARVATLPLLRQPGEAFDYGIADDLLGALIERASGRRFEDFVAARITGPLGMRDTFFDVPAEKRARVGALHQRVDGTLAVAPVFLEVHAEPGRGFASGGAGLFSTIEDYARFAQCLLDGGELRGVRILERETVELALRDSLPTGVDVFDATQGWGLFSAVQRAESPAQPGHVGLFSWGGAATTNFFADPSEELLALVFAQHLPYDEPQLFGAFRKAVFAALAKTRAKP